MKNTLAQNALFNVLYSMLNVIFPLITASYISRVIEPAGIGKVAYAQNIVSYFVMFATLGIPAYGTREVAKCQGERNAINKLVSELFALNFLSTAVCLGAYYSVVKVLFSQDLLIYLVIGLELIFNFLNIDWLFQGQEEYGYITFRSLLVKCISMILLLLFVKNSQDYVIYALIVCMGTGGNYLFNMFHARSLVKFELRGLNLKRHLRPVFILLLSSATGSLYNKVDTTMLGWLSTSETVGFYTNAHKVVNIVLTLVTAISAVFLPRLSFIYQKERDNYNKTLSMGLKCILLLAIPGSVGLFMVADELTLVFFGQLFAPAASTLRILTILVFIRGVGDLLCYQAIISTGNEKHFIKSRVIASVVNIILNGILIPKYEQNGAAIASVISELIVNGIMLHYFMQTAKLRVESRFVVSVVVGTGVMTIVVHLLKTQIDGTLVRLLLSVVLGAISYIGTALLMKNDMLLSAVNQLRNARMRGNAH